MKTYNLFALSVFALLAMQLVNTTFAQSDALSIANLAVNPQPVVAGENMTLQFQLYNSYTNQLTNVNLGLYGSYPIFNSSPADTQLLSNIPTGLYGGTAFLFYTIHIPKNVKSGTYTIDAIASYQTIAQSSQYVSGTSTMPISFYVQGIPNIHLTANPTSAVTPGSKFTVAIDALNAGTDNATDVSLAIADSPNFSVIGASNFALGTIQPQGTAVATAILQPNSTLKQGNATIPVMLTYQTSSGKPQSELMHVPVSIFVSTPDIAVSVTSAQPASIYPGSNQTLTLSIQNIGTGLAKNLTINLLSTNNITVGNSASDIFIGSLAANSSTTHSVLITANKNDNQNSYQLPMYISYQNANYQGQVNRTEYLPIKLQPSAIFNVTAISGNLAPGATDVPVVLSVKNTGNEAAQSVTFTLETIYPISQINPNAYLQSIAPGQSENITFYVTVDSQANAGKYPITLYDQWTQQSGTQQTYSSSQNYYAQVTTSSGLSTTTILIAVIVVVVAVVAYRRMKASSSKKEKK